jgi:hypothetical protein
MNGLQSMGVVVPAGLAVGGRSIALFEKCEHKTPYSLSGKEEDWILYMGPPTNPSFNFVSHVRLTILFESDSSWPTRTTPTSTSAENATTRSVVGFQGATMLANRLVFPQLRLSRGFVDVAAMLWSTSKYSDGITTLNNIRNRCPCRIHAENRADVVLNDFEGFPGQNGAARYSPTCKERLWKCNKSNRSGFERVDSCSSPDRTHVLFCCCEDSEERQRTTAIMTGKESTPTCRDPGTPPNSACR